MTVETQAKIKHNLTFEPEEHRYFLDDEEIPGVTRILALAGLTNHFNQDEEAALRGQYVHTATVLFDDNELDWLTLDPVLLPFVSAYQKFTEQYPHKIIKKELGVYSATYRFAGRLDRVIEVDNHLELYDIATGGLDPAKALQTAAYDICYEEMMGQKIQERFGLQLKDNGSFSRVSYKERTDRGVFLGALAGVNWRRNHR